MLRPNPALLRALREKSGLSRTVAARKALIDYRTLDRWEGGIVEGDLHLNGFVRLAEVYGFAGASFLRLLEDTSARPPRPFVHEALA